MRASLGRFEELILLALLRLGPDAYGLALRREVEERTGREVSTGALYTKTDSTIQTKRLFDGASPNTNGKQPPCWLTTRAI